MRKLIFGLAALLLSLQSSPVALAYDCPRGDAAMEAEDFDGAIRSFTNCLAVVTDQEEKRQIFLARGDMYVLLGRFIDANLDYQVALTIDREHPDVHLRLSRLASAQENFREAIDHASQAIMLDPDHIDSYRARGIARLRQGFVWRAFDDLTVVAESRPDDLQVRVARADVLRAIGEPHQAMEEIQAVLAVAPEDKEALLLHDVLVEILERIANQ